MQARPGDCSFLNLGLTRDLTMDNFEKQEWLNIYIYIYIYNLYMYIYIYIYTTIEYCTWSMCFTEYIKNVRRNIVPFYWHHRGGGTAEGRGLLVCTLHWNISFLTFKILWNNLFFFIIYNKCINNYIWVPGPHGPTGLTAAAGGRPPSCGPAAPPGPTAPQPRGPPRPHGES